MTKPDWTTLNAYVDGELTPREAARVADFIADSEDASKQVALLMRLKVGVADVPETLNVSALDTHSSQWSWHWLVASFCSALVLLGVIVLDSSNQREKIEASVEKPLPRLAQRHETWAEMPADAAVPIDTSVDKLELLGINIQHETILAGIQMRLVHAANTGSDGQFPYHLGYRGQKGCQVSLFIGPHSGEILAREAVGPFTWSWSTADFHYIAHANSMDPDRFGLIVSWLVSSTRNWHEMPQEQKTLLTASRLSSVPCA